MSVEVYELEDVVWPLVFLKDSEGKSVIWRIHDAPYGSKWRGPTTGKIELTRDESGKPVKLRRLA